MTLTADSTLVDRLHPSPNVEPRRDGAMPDMLVLHYTGMLDCAKAIDWLSRPESKVSCHYVVDLDGTITQMVDERLRAWHAGVSVWSGISDINSCSIGIEIHNAGHDLGYPDFPEVQMRRVIALCQDIVRRLHIRPERVLAHSDIAPARKIDPGEKFDWRRLWTSGIGHWIEPIAIGPAEPSHGLGDTGPDVSEIQALLAAYGYGIAQSGTFDRETETVLKAFQRHFRPASVDGRLDRSTRLTLIRLIDALGPAIA